MKNKYNFFDYILLFMPIIDVITSVTTRCFSWPITLGAFIKGLTLFYFIFYVFFITNSKFKKLSKVYILSIIIFVFLYFIFKLDLLSSTYFVDEIYYIFKFTYLPIMFSSLLCFYEDNEFCEKKIKNILLANLFIYAVFLIIPFLTGTAFNTYIDGSYGYVGWYYSGNELSAILILLFPFLYSLIEKNKVLAILLSIPIIFIISNIGTKVTFFGMLILAILLLICCFISTKSVLNKNFLCTFFISILVVIIMYNGHSINNMNKLVINATEDLYTEELGGMIDNTDNNVYIDKLKKISIALLSERNVFVKNTNEIFCQKFSLDHLLFGLGFSDTNRIDNIKITKMIEIDLLDVFYHFGIIGLILLLTPFVYVFSSIIISLKDKKIKFNSEILFYTIIIFMMMGISCISGHVLINPAVSLYVNLYLVLLLGEMNMFKSKKELQKKVSILSLHLGYGGAERATVDLANMLCKQYNVELVSLYKTVDNCPFKIDKKVKVIYLTSLKPNKDMLLQKIKRKQYIQAFVEGLKSCKILFLKYKKMRNYIIASDAKYIISTRFYFTKLLNKFGKSNCVKLAIEHNYDINKKYIMKVKNNTKYIDKLILVSKSAEKEYKKYMKNVMYIPNVINTISSSCSKINNKNLISVGRLESEKGFDDLISVMKLLVDKDPNYQLNLFGDGSERVKLEKMIRDLKLDNNITLHGFKPIDVINKYYQDASLYIMTSHKESFGIVLLEAMACGVPVIAFDSAAGACDIIDNNNGFLIKDRDCEDMVRQIIKFSNLKNKDRIQKKCIETVKKFDVENVSKIWFELLENFTNDSCKFENK